LLAGVQTLGILAVATVCSKQQMPYKEH